MIGVSSSSTMSSVVLSVTVLLSCLTIANSFEFDPNLFDPSMPQLHNDLGDFEVWTCTGEGDDRSCSFSPDSLVYEYAGSVGMFAAINIAAIIMVLLVIIVNVCSHVFSCFFKCCRCCFKCCTCCCRPPPDPNAVKQVDDYGGKYTKMDYCRIFSFVIVIVGIPICCILSSVLGVEALSANSSGMVNAPQGFADFIVDSEPVVTQQAISQVGDTFVPLFEGLNGTINQAISIEELEAAAVEFNNSLDNFPHVQTFIDIGYDIANLTTNASSPFIDGIIDELVGLNDTLSSVTAINDEILTNIDIIGAQNIAIIAVLGDTNETVNELYDVTVALLGDGDTIQGTIPSISEDLGALPSSGPFLTAGTSVASLSSGAQDGNPGNIGDVADDCTAVFTTTSALPDYDTTATALASLNTTIRTLVADGGIFDQLIEEIDDINGIIQGYPSFESVGDLLLDLESTILEADIFAVLGLLSDLLDLFNIVPEWILDVHDEVSRLKSLVTMGINVTEAFTNQLYTINSTIIGLPDNIMDITNITTEFDQNEVFKQIDDILELISDSNKTVTDFLVDGQQAIDDASEFNTTLSDTLNEFNISQYIVQLREVDDSIASVDFADTVDMLTTLRSDIAAFNIDSSFSDALRLLQDYFDTLRPLLRRAASPSAGGANNDAVGDYLLLKLGYCSTTTTQNDCSSDSDCPSAETCTNKGKYRCADDGATACTDDSDCSGSYCLADADTITNLAAALSGYGAAQIDSGTLTSALDDLNNFDSSVDQIDAARVSVAEAKQGAETFNVSDVREMVADFGDAIADLDVSDMIDQVLDAQQEMADLEVEDKLDPFKNYGKEQRRLNRNMGDVLLDIATVRSFFFDPAVGLAVSFANLAPSILQSIYSVNGPSFTVKHIVSEIDRMNNYFADNIVSSNISRTDRASEYNSTLDTLDKMGGYAQAGYGDMRENGATYYLLRLFNVDTVLASRASFAGIWVDSNGNEYPDDITCTMEACEDHTLTYINDEPLSAWYLEMPWFPEVGVDFTLSEIFLMMWIPPLITSFLGLFVFALNFKFYYEKTRKCCTFMFMGCVCCQIPFILLFTAMIFPMTVMLSDVCDSGANIGTGYLVAYGDDFCSNAFGGEGTLNACEIVVDTIRDENITFSVNILGMYESVVAGKCSGEDPFSSIMDTFSDAIVDQPSDALEDWFEDNEDMELREPVKNVMRTAAVNEGASLASFFTFAGTNLLNCEHFAGFVNEFSGATCGSFMIPFLWLVGSWYLAAWIIVCCAFPAGCLKKRYNLVDPEDPDGETRVDLLDPPEPEPAPETDTGGGGGDVELTELDNDIELGIDSEEGDHDHDHDRDHELKEFHKDQEEGYEVEVRENNWK